MTLSEELLSVRTLLAMIKTPLVLSFLLLLEYSRKFLAIPRASIWTRSKSVVHMQTPTSSNLTLLAFTQAIFQLQEDKTDYRKQYNVCESSQSVYRWRNLQSVRYHQSFALITLELKLFTVVSFGLHEVPLRILFCFVNPAVCFVLHWSEVI